jgi:hypothetical protein
MTNPFLPSDFEPPPQKPASQEEADRLDNEADEDHQQPTFHGRKSEIIYRPAWADDNDL